MDFQELLDRYFELREAFEAGEIDEDEFQDEIEGLQFRDEQGLYWTIGAETGKWYRYDGQDWIQETPIPMTRHQGRGTPEPIVHVPRDDMEGAFVPRWAYFGCSGIILLAVVAAVIIFAGVMGMPTFWQSQGVELSQAPTPTLVSGIPEDTPTPGPTPEPTATPAPTLTVASYQVYANSAFGFSVEYPDDWQAKEGAQQVVLAPDVAGLGSTNVSDDPTINSVAFAVGQQDSAQTGEDARDVVTQMLAALPADPGSGETGTRTVNGVKWIISQVTLNGDDPTREMIAYVAATVYGQNSYTLLAAAPTDLWNSTAPTFQDMFDSLKFSGGAASAEEPAVSMLGSTTPSADGTEDEPSADTTNNVETTPAVTPEPTYYIVQSGDTLGGIAFQFDVDVDDLQAINGIDDPASLSIGQELVIPDENYSASGSGAATATPKTAGTAVARVTSTPTRSAAAAATEESELGGEDVITGTTTITGTGTITGSTTVTGTTSITGTAEAEATGTPVAAVSAEDDIPLTGNIIYPVYVPERTLQGQPGSYDIWMSDTQGNNQQVVVYDASQPDVNVGGDLLAYRSWSPSGRGVAFTTLGGGRGGLLTGFVEDGLPAWDPSSLTITFSSRREGDRVPRIYRVNQANQEEYGLGLIGEYVSVFPNGRLAFKGCTPEGACGMFVAGPGGTGADFVTNVTNDTAPAPSPDGGKVAFMNNDRDGTGGDYEIFVMDSGGGNIVQLTDNGAQDGLPAWSPDGEHIAYASNQDGNWAIWVMRSDGSSQRKLFNTAGGPDGIVGAEEKISKGWLEERITWGP